LELGNLTVKSQVLNSATADDKNSTMSRGVVGSTVRTQPLEVIPVNKGSLTKTVRTYTKSFKTSPLDGAGWYN
jgi:hypothetical protein